MNRLRHRLGVDPHELAVGHGGCGTHANGLARERSLAKEVAFTQYPQDRFFAGMGYDGEAYVAFFNIENCVGDITLPENDS